MQRVCGACGAKMPGDAADCPSCGVPYRDDPEDECAEAYETDEMLEAVVLDRDDLYEARGEEEETAEIDAISGRADLRRRETQRRLRESGAIEHLIPEGEGEGAEEEGPSNAQLLFLCAAVLLLGALVVYVFTR